MKIAAYIKMREQKELEAEEEAKRKKALKDRVRRL